MKTPIAMAVWVVVALAACSDDSYLTGASDSGGLEPAALGVQLEATLTGAAEVPGPGDPDGSGLSKVRVSPQASKVCWLNAWQDIGTPTAAHIHEGAAGVAGPIVVPLTPVAEGCVTAHSQLLRTIIRNPDQYYVNIHNDEFPGGAIRGQLSD